MSLIRVLFSIILLLGIAWSHGTSAQVLDKQKQLDAQTFWENRDWDWHSENSPCFE